MLLRAGRVQKTGARAGSGATGSGSLFPRLGFGLGLRAQHYPDVLAGRSRPDDVAWFEVVSENYMGAGGRPLHVLEKIRASRPIVLHGVSLNIGSTDALDSDYLARLKQLADRVEPVLISDHACWTGVNGRQLHDLFPLPYNEETIAHVASRVARVQDVLKRRILLENVSSYLTYSHSEMEEWEFLSEIARRADCGLLLDINNIYVSSMNHGFDADEFLEGVPIERVAQFHLAGHTKSELPDGRTFLIDTHDHDICPEVWALYEKALRRFGAVSTMIERDANIPTYDALEAELAKARDIARRVVERAAEARERSNKEESHDEVQRWDSFSHRDAPAP